MKNLFLNIPYKKTVTLFSNKLFKKEVHTGTIDRDKDSIFVGELPMMYAAGFSFE
jgi:hypothetical protein